MKKRRLISVLLIAMLILSSMTVSVSAASSSKGYVTVTVKQDYAQVQQVLNNLNKERAKRGLRKVKLDTALTNAAVRRAAESAIYMDPKHTRPDGRKCRTVNKKANRENWATGYPTGADVVTAWMNSPGHKKNNLAKDAKSVGIAFITSGEGSPYCVLILSRSKASKQLKKKTGTKTYNIKVTAKSKYLKKSFFSIGTSVNEEYYSGGFTEVYVKPGTTTQLYVHYSSKYAGNSECYTRLKSGSSNFKWSSNDNSTASISANGVLTAKKEGWVTITAVKKSTPKVIIKRIVYITEDDPYDYLYNDEYEYFDDYD